MQIKRRRLATVALAVGLAVSVAACGGSSSSSKSSSGSTSGASAKKGGTFRLGIVEPTAIDPFNAQESEGILVTKYVFDQLVGLDAKANVVPSGATKWASNADCTQWTFNLRPNDKFSNGEAVTAKSYIDGWTRAAAKDAASDVAYHMAGIAGFDELNTGTATTFSGLSAPDPSTLEVKLSAPDCEFVKKTLQTVFSPVPSTAGAASNKSFNDMPIGNGPFKLAGPWQHDKAITMVRNDQYAGAQKANIDRVEVTILNSENAATLEYNGLKGSQFDYARIPPTLLGQAKSTYEPQGGWIKYNAPGINYLLVNNANAPLNSADARQAISYAIDRDAIISGVFKGFQTKATSLIPPFFPTYYQDGVCASCVKQDKAKAKELAAKAGLTPGTTLNFSFNTGGGHEEWVQAVAAQLKDVLGLNVNVVGGPFKELLQNEKKPNASGIYRSAWGADYPTPDNFLFPLLSTKAINPNAQNVAQGDNAGRYSNKQFDDLLAKERAAKTDADRKGPIQQAEKLAIGQDQALIPLWYRTQYRVFDANKWTGVGLDFFENPTLSTLSLK
jgi:peptide/nickel transport system substrate-binding protein/oligopeptide transport system substrate-binding protein